MLWLGILLLILELNIMHLPIAFPFISSISVSRSFEKPLVFVEVIPRQIIDIVTKPFVQCTLARRSVDDVFGYQSINDAVINAKCIGFTLSGQVKPENLFFFFSKAVKGLNQAFFEFSAIHKIPYNRKDFYAPVYGDQGCRSDECYADPLAIVLCKLEDTNRFREMLFAEKQETAKDTDSYQVSWSELQRLDNLLNIEHI
jgi:hypothetical protein